MSAKANERFADKKGMRGNMKKFRETVAALALAFTLAAFGGSFTQGKATLSAGNASGDVIRVISPGQDASVNIDNDCVSDFFENYEPNYGMKYYGQGENLPMLGVTLKWEADNAKYYGVYVDTNESFATADNYTAVKSELTVSNLIPGTKYYWKVVITDPNGKRKTSKTYSFTPEASVRAVNIDGVSNVRDLGGAVTADGRTLKYGVVYRSAILDDVTAEGKRTVARLGIKVDLDLRGKDSAVSPLGESVRRINVNAPWYAAGKGSFGVNGREEYVREFVREIKICADPDNYPMLFHCQIGRDRTGTLAATLLSLCGVSRSDITRDYELSWLSVKGSPSTDKLYNTRIDQLMDFYESQDGETLKEKTANYLLSLGVEQSEIDSITNILLG